MRIVSLLPSVTEIVVALGLGGSLVGRTHECDHPAGVAGVRALTADRLRCAPYDSAGIDRAVARSGGRGIYALDERGLAEARPDLVITQALCEVCAVAYDEVREAADRLPRRPEVLSLEPQSLEGVLQTILVVGVVTDRTARAEALVESLRERLARVREAVADRPVARAACLEWLDPPYAAGHWVPDQVEAAGGHDPIGRPGTPSVQVAPRELVDADPEAILLMPCGWSAQEAAAALDVPAFVAAYGETRAVREDRVFALDGSSYFNRPGPRLVDGVEILAALLHPEVAPVPVPPDAALPLRLAAAAPAA